MKILSAIFLILSCSAALAENAEFCTPGADCANECISFPDSTALLPDLPNGAAKLKYGGKVYDLKAVSRTWQHKGQKNFELPGDVQTVIYEGKKIRVEMKLTVVETSCYVKDEHGKLQEVDTDCGGEDKILLNIKGPFGKKSETTMWNWGC